jgi:hypothetical protein
MRHGLFAFAISLDGVRRLHIPGSCSNAGNQPPMTPAITAVTAAKKIPSTLLAIADEVIE